MKRVIRLFLILLALSMLSFALAAQSSGSTSCEICHTSTDWFDQEQIDFVKSAHGAHQEVGLSCHDCHGGDPDPERAEDLDAMDPDFEGTPFVGAPARAEIPEFCGSCHSSLSYMRRFKPDARVDQVQEYWTSNHGKALRNGDEKVATCIDCHGAHDIQKVSNTEGRVYPTNVADTCGQCHSNQEYMDGYVGPHGQPLPVDQVSKWKRSVHAQSMFGRGDLSAPTCNDCHGNHGAAPPGVESVAFVCGQCHGREAELFRDTGKREAWETHDEYLEDGSTCDSCHDPFPVQIAAIGRFNECITCHENHAVVRPTIALLGSLPPTPCSLCHESAVQVDEPENVVQHYEQQKRRLLDEASSNGLEGEERFNWLVDQASQLEPHTTRGRDDQSRVMKPEFARLFEKFRIGKTTYTYLDPVTGGEVVAHVRQCTNCHRDPDSVRRATSANQLEAMKQLIGMTARAERILLAAQRGGVETREAQAALDSAVDSQIELEVLIHTFSAEGKFAEKYDEGKTHAMNALSAGQESLAELSYRRRGLFVALAIILLVLVALGLKIRQVSSNDVS